MNADEEDQAAPAQSPSQESTNNRLSKALSRADPVEDDLTTVIDATERRRIQNCITQRNYRM